MGDAPSNHPYGREACGPEALGAERASHADFFTNYGAYTPRLHCLQTAEGGVDWPWAIGLIALTLGVIGAYLRITLYWRRAYLNEKPEHRNRALMELMHIFVWCAVCGYGLSIVMFFWPAYRLLACALVLLNIWSWRFALRPDALRLASSAPRLETELRVSLERRNEELATAVAEATSKLIDAKNAADSANAAKSRFLANMSHELRTPLTAILGFAELLEEAPGLNGDEREQARAVRRNGEHLLTLVNDTLDLSKIEAGRMTIDRCEIDPRTLLSDIDALLRGRAVAKGISFEIRAEEPLPPRVQTDPTRARQILINLVGNAIKFTERGGVRVTVRTIGEPDRERLLFEVADTGVGIAPEQMEAIFRPFEQAEASTTRRFGGTGLGLTVSRRLARLLGGEVEVSSEPGAGSVFTFSLPLAPALGTELTLPDRERRVGVAHRQRTPAGAPAMPPPVSTGTTLDLRVLLAEDGPDNQRYIEHVLTRAGARVEIVDNGRDAVERAARARDEGRPYDLVLMDMQMPVLDGLGAVRELRERGYNGRVIALTANAMPGDRAACITAGCDDYVAKPIDRAGLLAACRPPSAAA